MRLVYRKTVSRDTNFILSSIWMAVAILVWSERDWRYDLAVIASVVFYLEYAGLIERAMVRLGATVVDEVGQGVPTDPQKPPSAHGSR